jgi:hypothetical protein
MHTKVWSGNLKEQATLKTEAVDGNVIIIMIL